MRDFMEFPDMCKKLKPFLGKKIDDLFLEYSIADTQERKMEIFQVVMALYSKYVNSHMLDQAVLLQMPQDNVVKGDYDLGRIEYPNKSPQRFGLRDKDWIRHMCITGMSGSGKTTFALRILNSFINKDKPFIVFDWKKSFRRLLDLSRKVVIFTIGKPKASNFFRFNINKPPKGISPDEWITILTDLLCEAYGTSYGVHKLLTEVIQRAFREFGVYEGSENYPTWFQIRDRLEKMADEVRGKGRQSEWITSAQRIAHSLTFGEFGNTINDKSKNNLTIEELLQNQVVFELDALGTMEKKFFCSYMLLYIYKYKKTVSTSESNGFKSAIVVDEAHNIFLRQRMTFVQESVTDTIYREIREYGVSLVCLDQHASKLSETVLGNSATNIAFQQILPADVDAISRLMFLYEDKNIFTRLKVGQAVVKLTDRFFDPFLLQVEQIVFKGDIIDDEKLRAIIKKNVLFKKRLRLCQDLMDTDKLANEIRRLDAVTQKSGVKVKNKEDLEKQIRIKHEMDQALEEKKKRTPITNHLQNNILEDIEAVVDKTKSLRAAKKYFQNQSYKNSDIQVAFKRFLETERGDLVARFLDAWNSQITNSRSSKINNYYPLGILCFLQQLQKTNQSLSVTRLYKLLDFSVRKANAIRNDLEKTGLINICEERTDKGITKKIQFTVKGAKLAETLGITE